MPEKKHLHFQTEEIELNRVKNAKLIHFKDELGRPIDGQLVIGEVKEVKEKEFSRPVEVEVKRNLGKFKKALAYLGIIKNTKKVIKEENYTEKVVSKEEKIIGTYELGNFTNDKNSIENFLNNLDFHEEKLYAYDLSGKKIGEVGDFGKVVLDENIKLDETILQKNGKVFAIEKNGKFLDLEGKALQNQNKFIQKSSGVYHLSTSTDIKYFDKDEDIKTSRGITNLNTKPVKSALKGSREATKIGEKLRKQQEEQKFAGIKKPKGAKLTQVGIPVVPTRG